MERFLLYLDDLDDYFFAFGLVGERVRRWSVRLSFLLLALLGQALAVQLAVQHPSLGAALAALLTVAALYRSATAPKGKMGGIAQAA